MGESTYSVALVVLAGAADAAKLAADGRWEAPYLLRRAAGRGAALAVGPVNHVGLHAGAGSERGGMELDLEERGGEKRGGGWERTRRRGIEGGRRRETERERAKRGNRGGDGDGNGGDNGGDARRTANKMAASSLSVHGSVGASIRRQHDSASDEQSRIEWLTTRCACVSCRAVSSRFVRRDGMFEVRGRL